MSEPKYITRVNDAHQLSEAEKASLSRVSGRYPFRANEYYLNLIDWGNPKDPLRRIVIPSLEEVSDPLGDLDPCREASYVAAPGLEHKYRDTAVLLVSRVCGGNCRFCFRKRLFINDADETARDVQQGIDYIRKHNEITNVLLTGGDALMLSTNKLASIIEQLRQVEHLQIIRIGTKLLAFNPSRVIDDPSLPEMIARFSTPRKRIYVMSHFNHPREITDASIQAIYVLQRAGAILTNQTPLVRGVNDDHRTLSELFQQLSFLGVPPYYVFQCRPTRGNIPYTVPLERGFSLFQRAQTRCAGLAKRARFVMSHATGKIEVVAMTNDRVFMRYHRTPDPVKVNCVLEFRRNSEARWLEDYQHALHRPTVCHVDPYVSRGDRPPAPDYHPTHMSARLDHSRAEGGTKISPRKEGHPDVRCPGS